MTTYLFALLMIFSPLIWAHEGHATHGDFKAHLMFKNKTVHLHAELTAPPKVGTESILTIQARNGSDHSILNLQDSLDVELWMPTMGHGSAPTQIEHVLDTNGQALPGLFKVRNLYFVMGGDWEVKVKLTDTNGQEETQTFTVVVPE